MKRLSISSLSVVSFLVHVLTALVSVAGTDSGQWNLHLDDARTHHHFQIYQAHDLVIRDDKTRTLRVGFDALFFADQDRATMMHEGRGACFVTLKKAELFPHVILAKGELLKINAPEFLGQCDPLDENLEYKSVHSYYSGQCTRITFQDSVSFKDLICSYWDSRDGTKTNKSKFTWSELSEILMSGISSSAAPEGYFRVIEFSASEVEKASQP